jgi:hypothetical protein
MNDLTDLKRHSKSLLIDIRTSGYEPATFVILAELAVYSEVKNPLFSICRHYMYLVCLLVLYFRSSKAVLQSNQHNYRNNQHITGKKNWQIYLDKIIFLEKQM